MKKNFLQNQPFPSLPVDCPTWTIGQGHFRVGLLLTFIISGFAAQGAAAPDPGNLAHLHDIIEPPAVSWWPLAPGWYALFLALGCGFIGYAWIRYRAWQASAYRREALRELAGIRDQAQGGPGQDTACMQMCSLLKRTALAAFPRAQVAALSGKPWLTFLNQSAPSPLFSDRIGETLVSLAYDSRQTGQVPPEDLHPLFESARQWIETHQPPVQPPNPRSAA